MKAIIAVAENGVIGNGDKIPWRMRDDMRFFRQATIGKTVICGRKTLHTLPKDQYDNPHLDMRDILTLTNYEALSRPYIRNPYMTFEVIEEQGLRSVPVVIGGAATYEAFWPLITSLAVTVVRAEPEGDVRFDRALSVFDSEEWKCSKMFDIKQGKHNDHDATVFICKRQPVKVTAAIVD